VFAIALDHWFAKTVWVFVQLLQRAALRTNETFTEHIITVASNACHSAIFDGDFQTTRGFT
jgi:hypothetical protein